MYSVMLFKKINVYYFKKKLSKLKNKSLNLLIFFKNYFEKENCNKKKYDIF